RPEPRLEPLSTVPFPHDPDFISRDGILSIIHEKSSVPGSRIVLVSLGGVGLGITGVTAVRQRKTRLIIEYCHRVRQQSTDTWVFWVYASTAARCEESLRNLADRAKIPGREDRNPPLRYLLGTSNGSIIIISRNKAVASEIAGHKKHLIDHKLDSCVERADLVQLIEELKFMPLAIMSSRTVYPVVRHRNTSKNFGRVIDKP
ncbi:hypothetical protein N7486_005030, partial [Penicillium sp. IBT 16267x]